MMFWPPFSKFLYSLLKSDFQFQDIVGCSPFFFPFTSTQQRMGFWTLLEGFLLFANALAILNEDRFLAPRGWTFAEMTGPTRNSLKGQIIGVIYACQFLRLPLILVNVIIIVVKLFTG